MGSRDLPSVVVGALACAAVACGSDVGAPREGVEPADESATPLESLSVDAQPWDGTPGGFQTVRLPEVRDSCEGPTVWIGEDFVSRVPPLEGELPFAPPAELAPGPAREVAALVRPRGALALLRSMSGSYNGPGGAPLFFWHLERTLRGPVLLFDRRVPRGRFEEALRGADEGIPLRIGGVDGRGERRCAVILVSEPADLGAQAANELLHGDVQPGGTLRVRGSEPSSETLIDAPETASSGSSLEGLHIVRIEPAAGVGVPDVLRALSFARESRRRYGWLALPARAP